MGPLGGGRSLGPLGRASGLDPAATALLTSLESWWKLDEASGTGLDEHGANDLTDNNTVTSTAGQRGTSRHFTAADNESLSIADNASLSVADIDFTFAMWVYLDTTSATYRQAGGKYAPVMWEYAIIKNTANVLYFWVSNDGSTSGTPVYSTITCTTATWYFVVGWHDATANTVNIQVNNETAVSAAHSTGVYNGTGVFYLGRSGFSGNEWDGRIDEAAFWKRVLTTAERTYLYNSGTGRTLLGGLVT